MQSCCESRSCSWPKKPYWDGHSELELLMLVFEHLQHTTPGQRSPLCLALPCPTMSSADAKLLNNCKYLLVRGIRVAQRCKCQASSAQAAHTPRSCALSSQVASDTTLAATASAFCEVCPRISRIACTRTSLPFFPGWLKLTKQDLG